jgi:hypothetical protein
MKAGKPSHKIGQPDLLWDLISVQEALKDLYFFPGLLAL